MSNIIGFLSHLGSVSIYLLWTPLLIWTVLAILIMTGLHYSRGLSARHLFHAYLALLSALPAGYVSYLILHSIPRSNVVVESLTVVQFGLPVTTGATSIAASHITLLPDTWIGMIIIMLALGIIGLLLHLVGDHVRLLKFCRDLDLRDHYKVPGISVENRNLAGSFRKKILFAFADNDIMPMTFGFYRPIIVLPAFLNSDSIKMNLAIHHELEHIRQHDYFRFWLIRLLKVFFWFHPLIWLIEKNIATFREMDIDETVISQNRGSSSVYAHLLLDIAAYPVPQLRLPVRLPRYIGGLSTIKKRITAMTHIKKNT